MAEARAFLRRGRLDAGIPIGFLFCGAAGRLERLCPRHDNPVLGRSGCRLRLPLEGLGTCGRRPIGNAPVERTKAMDIAMLALGFVFFAAALAYVAACDAL